MSAAPPLVSTHDPKPTNFRLCVPEVFHGFKRIRRPVCLKFNRIYLGPINIRECDFQPPKPDFTRRRRPIGFVGRNPTGNESHFIKAERIFCKRRQMNVPLMDRIKRSSKNSDFSHTERLRLFFGDRHQESCFTPGGRADRDGSIMRFNRSFYN